MLLADSQRHLNFYCTVARNHQGAAYQPLSWAQTFWWYPDTLSTGARSCCLGDPTWWWLLGCVQERHCHYLLWWGEMASFSENIHIFYWLPWKVCLPSCVIDWSKLLDRVILATIWDKGRCPCPRCFVPASLFDRLGWLTDAIARVRDSHTYFTNKIAAARNSIYKYGVSMKGAAVEALLKELSLVPTVVGLLY